MDVGNAFQGNIEATRSSPLGSHNDHVKKSPIQLGEVDKDVYNLGIRNLVPVPVQPPTAKKKPLFGRKGAANDLVDGLNNIQTEAHKTENVATGIFSKAGGNPQVGLPRLLDQVNVPNGDLTIGVAEDKAVVQAPIGVSLAANSTMSNAEIENAFITKMIALGNKIGSLSLDEKKEAFKGITAIAADGSETGNFKGAVAIDDKETKTTFVKSNLSPDVLKKQADRCKETGFRMVIMSEKNWNCCVPILSAIVVLINKEKQREIEKKESPVEIARSVGHTVKTDKETINRTKQEGVSKENLLLSKDFKEEVEALKGILKAALKKAIIDKTNEEMQADKKEEFDIKLKRKVLFQEVMSQEIEEFETRENDRRYDKDIMS